jgi:hypothetical protein
MRAANQPWALVLQCKPCRRAGGSSPLQKASSSTSTQRAGAPNTQFLPISYSPAANGEQLSYWLHVASVENPSVLNYHYMLAGLQHEVWPPEVCGFCSNTVPEWGYAGRALCSGPFHSCHCVTFSHPLRATYGPVLPGLAADCSCVAVVSLPTPVVCWGRSYQQSCCGIAKMRMLRTLV